MMTEGTLPYESLQNRITIYHTSLLFFVVFCPKTTHCKYVLIYFIALFKESKRIKAAVSLFSWVCVSVNTIF